ncbi:helix-turn-helix transcriptional regulator [Actinokineospora auranticolor]|uniref:Regulatory LuxR family protein n=1 Tax=Actinokineospora auranticolor TaxID=155976 RepID=A0A2S6GDH7_9PSEU|nr:helix-turn-helix transcriptional regulator [Actinokineospora auranticolor]PPK63304.1 regulatory LuxR family protein [Actinokineospora auranticolor]
MREATNADLRLAREIIDAIDRSSPDAVLPSVIAGLMAAVDAEIGTSNVFEPRRMRNDFRTWPPGAMDTADHEAYRAYTGQQPLLEWYARTRQLVPVRWSDIVSLKALRGRELYEYFYRPVGIDRQLALALPLGSGEVHAIALSRGGSDFTDRDVVLVSCLQASLLDSLYETTEAARIAELVDSLSCLENPAIQAFLVHVDASGIVRVTAGNPEAVPAGHEFSPGKPLTPTTSRLVATARKSDVHLGRITAGARDARPGTIILFRSEPNESQQIRQLAPGERAALEAVATGASIEEAAQELCVSKHTVKNQLDRVHKKLNARNRADAVGVLWRSGWRG